MQAVGIEFPKYHAKSRPGFAFGYPASSKGYAGVNAEASKSNQFIIFDL